MQYQQTVWVLQSLQQFPQKIQQKRFLLLFWSLAKRREVISPNFLHLLQLAKLGKIGHSLIHRQVLMIERLTKFFLGGFLFPPKPTRPNWSFILTNLQLQSTYWSRVCKNGKASNLRTIKDICVCSVIWASSALPCVAAVSPQGKLGFAGWPWCLFFSTTSQLEDELAPRHLWLWDPTPLSTLHSCFVSFCVTRNRTRANQN